nr:MAG TPA: Minor capsid protein [Caudoviricetes sp.]
MASKIFHFPSFSIVKGDIKVNVSLNRFEKQFQEAQNWLDGRVFTDMEKYMPFRDGNMRNVSAIMSRSMQGSGQVIAGAPPYGRFLYERKVMIDPVTGSPWARAGAKKVVTDRDLVFDKTAHPRATDHWFDAAKEQYVKSWAKGVKKRAGGK